MIPSLLSGKPLEAGECANEHEETALCGCGSEPGDCSGVWCARCDGHHADSACVEIAPRKEWYFTYEPGESGCRVAIFRRSEVEAAYGPITAENAADICDRLVGWYESYSGPGRGFSSAPSLMVKGSKVIVRQFTGLDI